MKEVDPLTKDLGLVLHLDSQAQFCVRPTQPSLQLSQDSLVHCEAAAWAGIRGTFKRWRGVKGAELRGDCGIKIPSRTVCETA
jgi:hypothetical protein